MKYLLRVESINFKDTITDTNDLSTIRGGGLRSLNVAAGVLELHNSDNELSKIYVGASQGLFEFLAASPVDAESLRSRARANIEKSFPELTVTVELAPSTEDQPFNQTLAQLEAQSRWAQLQSPSLVFPGEGDDVCHFDRIRPSASTTYRKGAAYAQELPVRVPISNHTESRRTYGIGSKHQQFYTDNAATQEDQQFASDLDQISDLPSFPKLHHKIALIYLDGNQFGSTFRRCNRLDFERLSNLVIANSNSWLRHTLGKLISAPGPVTNSAAALPSTPFTWSGKVTTNAGQQLQKRDSLRVETLMWGADEIVWALPAWAGWWWLEQFYQLWGATNPWQGIGTSRVFPFTPASCSEDKKEVKSEDFHMTFGASIVFCHHDAPIHDIWHLAEGLAKSPKRVKENRFAYQVLESFDDLGDEADKLRALRLPPELAPDPKNALDWLVLPGNRMTIIRAAINNIQSLLPRSAVHEIAVKLCRDQRLDNALELASKHLVRNKAEALFRSLIDSIFNLPSDSIPSKQQQAAAWIHLCDLWDYLPPVTWGISPVEPAQ